jgi:hypothetical protein
MNGIGATHEGSMQDAGNAPDDFNANKNHEYDNVYHILMSDNARKELFHRVFS